MDQRARLVALPTYTEGVKAAYEVDLVDIRPGEPVLGYVVFVDARSGAILFRHHAVDELAAGLDAVPRRAQRVCPASPPRPAAAHSDVFTGSYAATAPECGPLHCIPIDVQNRTLAVTAYPTVVVNDIQLIVRDPLSTVRGTSDNTGTGVPEAVVVNIPAPGQPGTWTAQVCESSAPVAESIPPRSYVGSYSAIDQAQPSGQAFSFPPQWNFFRANPPLPNGGIAPPFNFPDNDNRTHACWTTSVPGAPPECELDLTPNNGDTNLASPVPWDHNVQGNAPNFTTAGNNAVTAEAWSTDLIPGPPGQRPIDTDRTYGFERAGRLGITDRSARRLDEPVEHQPLQPGHLAHARRATTTTCWPRPRRCTPATTGCTTTRTTSGSPSGTSTCRWPPTRSTRRRRCCSSTVTDPSKSAPASRCGPSCCRVSPGAGIPRSSLPPQHDALAAIAPTTMVQLPGAVPELFAKVRRLSDAVPCYWLDAGTELSEIPVAVDELLTSLR